MPFNGTEVAIIVVVGVVWSFLCLAFVSERWWVLVAWAGCLPLGILLATVLRA
jgi:hypothetical protein